MWRFISIVDIHFLIGVVFVFVAGFFIGFERGSRGEPAGVRTHTLVCFGAMLFSLLSGVVDPSAKSRIAANIVTGVGFIGAGIIMHQKGGIKGLTTAASLWFSAAIGMAIGYGYYVISIIATLAAYVILKMPHIGEHGSPKYSTMTGDEEKFLSKIEGEEERFLKRAPKPPRKKR